MISIIYTCRLYSRPVEFDSNAVCSFNGGWLSKENDNVTQVDIANQGNADRMMVSKVLRTLEEKKFISRQEHPTDTRAKVIKLTGEGGKVLQKALTAIEEADIDFFSAIADKLPSFNSSMMKLIEQNKHE